MDAGRRCVKAEEFEWCQSETHIILAKETGQFYCIFHLPKEFKQTWVAHFKQRVREKILEAKDKDEICDLSGTVFADDIAFNFDKDNPFPQMDFSDAVFYGEADFTEAVFQELATFEGTRF